MRRRFHKCANAARPAPTTVNGISSDSGAISPASNRTIPVVPATGGVIISGDQGGVQLSQQISQDRLEGEKRVRVLEGREAFIGTGRSVPLSDDLGTVYVDASAGLYVRARVTGDSVRIDISPRRSAFEDDGTIAFQDVSTTVSGRRGEWIPIAGVDATTRRSSNELSAGSTTDAISSSTVFLKVDVLQH